MTEKSGQQTDTQKEIKKIDRLAVASLIISLASAAFTLGNLWTQRQALHASQSAALQAQRTALFSQFQQQYNTVSESFPRRFLDPKFRPAPGSDDYARLQAYWFFCFSEWYATHRVNPSAFGDLWAAYYAPLIADALKISSLRYVLEDRMRTRGVGGGDWTTFINNVALIARANREPLATDSQAYAIEAQTAERNATEVAYAQRRASQEHRR
jgi:hypothetical protein